MRTSKINNGLKVNAWAGTYVVLLGYDLPEAKCSGLKGFSIHRLDKAKNEAIFLEGVKTFVDTDPGFPAPALYPTNEQPIQGFQWADYAAEPGTAYTYTVTALKGTPDNLIPFAATSVDVVTESPQNVEHEIYFNRGSAASQEYIRRFGDYAPNKTVNPPATFKWLSRGLYEAMVEFVTSCVPGKHSLRIAAYEFNYEEFLKVLKATIKKGVDIEIVYDGRGKAATKASDKAIANVKLAKKYLTPRTEGANYISHNKFMVKLEDGNAVSVWTGGTNFSNGGISGHSNVAHVVNIPEVAEKYHEYWKLLQEDLIVPTVRQEQQLPDDERTMRKELVTLSPFPGIQVPTGTTPLFSPRLDLDVLNAYATLAASAQHGLFMTFAFGMNDVFKDVYKNSTAEFRLALMETVSASSKSEAGKKKEEKDIRELRNKIENVFAIGTQIKTDEFDGWVKERLTGLNVHVKYLHNKFMLIDPISDDPIVISGSANFSNASTTDNDENMVIIKGDTRVADIYLGEYMRLFSHFSFRESLQWRKPTDPPKPLDTTDKWWKDNFGNTARSSRRKYFGS